MFVLAQVAAGNKNAAMISYKIEISDENVKHVCSPCSKRNLTKFRAFLNEYSNKCMMAVVRIVMSVIGDLPDTKRSVIACSFFALKTLIIYCSENSSWYRSIPSSQIKHDTQKYNSLFHASVACQTTMKHTGKVLQKVSKGGPFQYCQWSL